MWVKGERQLCMLPQSRLGSYHTAFMRIKGYRFNAAASATRRDRVTELMESNHKHL